MKPNKPRNYTRTKEDNLNSVLHPKKAKHDSMDLSERLLKESNEASGYDLCSLLKDRPSKRSEGLTSFDKVDAIELQRWKIQSLGEYHSYMARWCRERAPFIQDEISRKAVWDQAYQHQEIATNANDFLIGKRANFPKPGHINMVLGRRN